MPVFSDRFDSFKSNRLTHLRKKKLKSAFAQKSTVFNLSFGNSDKRISRHNNSTKNLVTILTNLYIPDIIDVLGLTCRERKGERSA